MNKERIIIEIPSKTLHVEHANCPQGHSLMDSTVPINGYPSIKVLIRYGDVEGCVHLDPVYGSFHNLFDVEIPEAVIVDMFCPCCRNPLKVPTEHCDFCFSPMFALFLPNGGVLEGCLKSGCHQHKLRLVDVDAQLSQLQGPDHIQLLM
jgi:hypothetical protein